MKKPDIHRLLEFQKLLVDFQSVERRLHYPGTHKPENDTEHSYNLAMTAWYLSQYFPTLDRDIVIRYALVHDLVEVHAGDTYAYGDAKDLATKPEREAKALTKLKEDWHDFPEMTNLITDYESTNSDEVAFVYALDKIMPIMLIFLGEGYTWHKENIDFDKLHSTKLAKVARSPIVARYYDQLHKLLLEHPDYFPSKSKSPDIRKQRNNKP